MQWRNSVRLVYDDIYLLCSDDIKLQNWLRDQGLIVEFTGLCDKCVHGKLGLRKDKSYSRGGHC